MGCATHGYSRKGPSISILKYRFFVVTLQKYNAKRAAVAESVQLFSTQFIARWVFIGSIVKRISVKDPIKG